MIYQDPGPHRPGGRRARRAQEEAFVIVAHNDWSRDELILALDVYVQWEGMPPSKASWEITDLSEAIMRLRQALGSEVGSVVRSADVVHMKIMNFRRFDPALESAKPAVWSPEGRLDKLIWDEFSKERERLARIAGAIRSVVAVSSRPLNDTGHDFGAGEDAVEGRLLTLLHRRRERARHLVEKKKRWAWNEYGRLACEVCAFDFAARYGKRGKGFMECHHTKAVETLGDCALTRIQDLALVCSNCHYMIHSRRPWLSLADLRAQTAQWPEAADHHTKRERHSS